MKVLLDIVIECGEKTCASEPGKFCPRFRQNMRGDQSCSLFGRLEEDAGWVQRHPDCLIAAKGILS